MMDAGITYSVIAIGLGIVAALGVGVVFHFIDR